MPKYFKVIAIAGIAANSMALAIGYPIEFVGYFYGLFGEESWSQSYTIIDKISWFIGIPLAFALLIASVGLLNRKEWGRKGCVVGLMISVIWGFIWLFSDLTHELAIAGEGLSESLIVAPILCLVSAFEVVVLIYLNGASVRGHMRGRQ